MTKLVVLAFFIFICPLVSKPHIPQTFFDELEQRHVPTRFIKETMQNLRGIVFQNLSEEITGYYNQITRTIHFTKDMQNPITKQLKNVDELSSEQLNILFHEFWHAYFYTIAKPQNLPIYRIWKQQAQKLYRHQKFKIHDEAYAIFIENILSNYLLIRKYFDKKENAYERDLLRSSVYMRNIYEQAFSKATSGYYVIFPRKFVYSSINLPQIDRLNILHNLFDDLIKKSYTDAFSEDVF